MLALVLLRSWQEADTARAWKKVDSSTSPEGIMQLLLDADNQQLKDLAGMLEAVKGSRN
jgi:hypothetical protein